MIDSFLVRNFRLFQHLELEKLARVNLFAGKNNSGKSALLEAVQIFACEASPAILFSLADLRDELYGPARDWSQADSHEYRHFFHEHSLPAMEEEGIVLGSLHDETNRVRLTIQEVERRVIRGVDGDEIEPVAAIVAERGGEPLHRIYLDRNAAHNYRQNMRRAPQGKITVPTQMVSAQSFDSDSLATLWDATSLTDLEDDVIKCLQLIEPGIRGLAFVESATTPQRRREIPGNRMRVPMIRFEGASEPLPLKSLGDGVLRLFHISLHLVNAQGGIVLIDEIENGIHWSVQDRVWNVVFELAERLDVQVFATTHSRDCVDGFGKSWQDKPEAATFHRLDRRRGDDMVIAVPYNCATLSDALESDVEVR